MRKSKVVTRSVAARQRATKTKKRLRIKTFKKQLEEVTDNFVEKMNSVISNPKTLALNSIYEWETENADDLFHIRKNQTFVDGKWTFYMIYATTKFILELDIDIYNNNSEDPIYDCECEILSSDSNEIDKAKVKQLVKDNVFIVYGSQIFNMLDEKFNFDIEWFE